MQKKNDAIVTLHHPKTFKQLKIFMGSVHHLNNFKPNLAQLCTPLRALLSANLILYGRRNMKQRFVIY